MAFGKIILVAIALSFLGACAGSGGSGDPFAGRRLDAPPIDYDALLTHPDRPGEDFSDDATRKPAGVLAFTGIGYGMTVVELEAGGGYYTELFSHAVGPTGVVYMQNPLEFDQLLGDALATRLDGRLENVKVLRTPFDEITLADEQADLVTWILGPHELWFDISGTADGALGDPDRAFAEIARVLKPDGVFVAVDHSAPAGAPATTGNTTHRIDPAIIEALAEEAGLRLIETSTLLSNPEDDPSISAFDPSVRRKTDRFMYKFVRD